MCHPMACPAYVITSRRPMEHSENHVIIYDIQRLGGSSWGLTACG
jgi:hypothetical protein